MLFSFGLLETRQDLLAAFASNGHGFQDTTCARYDGEPDGMVTEAADNFIPHISALRQGLLSTGPH